ncbi:MAG: hypothetical protein C0594_05385 [Marinilabiliales bacterium]|nr:MAG: hypothetical protein C0594_05385 [Marinilabiliales bacterium]
MSFAQINIQDSLDTPINENDSLKYYIKAYRINDLYELEHVQIDTNLKAFQNYIDLNNADNFNAYNGNLGQAAISNVSFNQKKNNRSLFFNPFLKYSYTPENLTFYNTTNHFTLVKYTNGNNQATREQTLNVLHTQNVSPRLNLGFNYDLISSLGQYKNQDIKTNNIAIMGNYYGIRYSNYFGVLFNKFNLKENGGIRSTAILTLDSLPTNAVSTNFEGEDPPVNILRNRSAFIYHGFYFGKKYYVDINDSVQQEKFEKKSKLGWITGFSDYKKWYTDENPISGYYHGIYVNETSPFYYDQEIINFLDSTGGNYIPSQIMINKDSLHTRDSAYFGETYSDLFFELSDKDNPIGDFGIRLHYLADMDFYRHEYFYHYDEGNLQLETREFNAQNFFNNGVGITGFKRNGEIPWKIHGQYYFTGYNAGDIEAKAEATKYFYKKDTSDLTLKISFSRLEPDYYLNHYYANNFKWDSSFVKEDKTDIFLIYRMPKWNLHVGAYYGIYDNNVYFDYVGYPRQETSTFNVQSFYIQKYFKWWKLRSINTLIYQMTDNDNVMRFPSLIIYNSTYFHHNFHFKSTGGNLLTQLGFQFMYLSSYTPYGYMAATNQFICQQGFIAPSHPYIDVFLNAKIKRFRFFLKAAHINALFMKRDYFTIAYYPMNDFAIRFGISWSFYD